MNIETEQDVKKFKDTVNMIKKFIEIPELKELRIQDKNKYDETMREYFPIFSSSYESLFKIIIDNNDITILDKMLKQILEIKRGYITKDKAEQNLGDLLAENFLYKK
jgi:hypothetical protein